LWSSDKQPVQNTQSASFSSSSSVESSAKVTVRSLSEYYEVSDGVWSRQTLLFRLFEGPRRAFDANQLVWNLVVRFIFFFWVASTSFLQGELCILFAVPPRGFGCRFRLGTAPISDVRRASAEVNGEKSAELNDGWQLVFTKAGWCAGASSLFSEDRGKSYGLKVFLSQGKKPVTRKPLGAISLLQLACMHFRIVRQFDRQWQLALGVNGAIF